MITPAYSPTATERVLPRMALDFTTAVLDSRVTVARALNTATVTNANGSISIVNANLPRFDYKNGVCQGLLIEEARTNVALNSILAGAVTGSPGTAPTSWGASIVGTTSIDAITPSTYAAGNALTISAVAGRAVYFQSQTLLANTTYTFSMDVDLTAGTTVTNQVIFINAPPAGSTVTYTLDGVAATSTTTIPSGVHRLTTTIAVAATAGTVSIRFGLGLQSGATATVKIYNLQFEVGAFATSYIPTVATSLTRNADVVSMTGTNFSDWYNASEGAFLAKFSFPAIPASQFRYVLSANDGTATNFIAIAGNTTSNVPAGRVIASSSTQASMGGGSIVANQQAIGVLAYKLDSFAYGQNGATIGTDATGLVPTVNRLDIGALTTSFACCHIQRVSYWPQRIINNEALAFSK